MAMGQLTIMKRLFLMSNKLRPSRAWEATDDVNSFNPVFFKGNKKRGKLLENWNAAAPRRRQFQSTMGNQCI